MSQELLYTSAPRGLKPGSRGFCTVLCTQGMPAPLAAAVEALSGYRPIFPSNDERAARNPVVYSHLKMQAAGRAWHVLSRIADYGLDYSQRANKLAHHVILDNQAERLPGGPANLLSMPGFMREDWEGEPKLVALKPVTREPRVPSGICERWKEMTGDAGWAGVVAESFLRDPDRLVILLFEPGQEMLPLFAEVLSLLPVEKRWDATFSTYFTGLATGTTCNWRAMIHDSKEAHESLRFVNALRIDLTSDSPAVAAGGDLVETARLGPRISSNNSKTHSKGAMDGSDADSGTQFSHVPQLHAHRGIVGTAPPVGAVPPKLSKRPRHGNAIAAESHNSNTNFFLLTVIVATLFLFVFGVCVGTSWITFPQGGNSRELQVNNVEKKDDHAALRETPATSTVATPLNQATDHAIGTSTEDQRIADDANALKDPVTPELSAISPTAPVAQLNQSETDRVDESVQGPTIKHIDEKAFSSVSLSESRVHPVFFDLVTVDTSPELYEFQLKSSENFTPKTTLPSLRFFRPQWLKYDDNPPTAVPKATSQRVLRVINFVEGTDVEVATITATLSDRRVTYKLRSTNEATIKHFKNLGWCRLQVLSKPDGEAPLKDLQFTDFPLRIDESKRRLNDSVMSWPVPESAPVERSSLPKLTLDRLVAAIGEKEYSLGLKDITPSSSWTIPLTDFVTDAYRELCSGPTDSTIVSLRLELRPNDSGSSFEFSMAGTKEFVESLKLSLNNEFSAKRASLIKQLKKAEQELAPTANLTPELQNKMDGVKRLVGFTVDNPLHVEKFAAIDAVLCQVHDYGSNQLTAQIDEGKRNRVKALLVEIEQERNAIGSFCDRAKRFSKVISSLSNARLAACHIYYELETKNHLQKQSVDVVSFDDTQLSRVNRPKESHP